MTRTIRYALGSVAALALLAGCGPAEDTVDTPAASATSESASIVPAGQLPEGVTPTAYRVDLRTDPDQATYTGSVSIDVRLDEPTREIYLHALGPEVSSAMAVYQGDNACLLYTSPSPRDRG